MKPSNIFLARREEDLEPLVKILDFGISKIVETSKEQPKLKLTRAGTVVGTPQYMSPEQAQGFSVDHRTDVWSLGLVLYEMLAGRPAYPELPTYEQFIIHLVSHPPDPLHEVAPWVPEALSRAVHAALEHDLDKRVQSCLELAKRLLAAHPVRSNLAVTGAAPIVDGRASAPDGEQHEDDEPIPPTDAAGGSTLVMSSPPPGMRSSDAPPPATKPLPARPAAAARRQATQPPPTPRMMDAPPSAGVSVEDEDDAPQFFRRDELQRIAEMARAGAAAAASAQAEATGTGTGTEPETTSAAPPSPLAESLRVPTIPPTIPPTVAVPELPPRASRARLLWALLIVVLGLGAVLAAVALR
jgi:serine/threonine-protein kinase